MGKKNRKATTGVLDFLQNALSKKALLELYTDETRGRFICRAVLQQLSSVGQQVVVRLSSCGGTFVAAGVKVWIAGNSYPQIMAELESWAIVTPEYDKEGAAGTVSLTTEFAKGLQETLLSPDSSPWKALSKEDIRQMEFSPTWTTSASVFRREKRASPI